ncbi:SDR family oxidoreductase [Planktothrix agardhii]|jgi:short-subunit dehydrogenase|uniref:Short-chain dehydrogenase n=2 Tax=Planktothrix agardhii TaxID=1160 RepID=A0A073CAP9_PLAA1|nr:SDR family oxidoreductase [Planktothrix agardhii]MCF3608629.1 SDR family oxidoreductase [Planktothrix agardhii 1033]BBD54255.1 putative short-chain dehydrogenase [Planktothrix agardhii NIES-204]KEI65359.1 short-chain dehydrogenase [Planktothrix agardhii NIVA-CYA 126/8]MBG0745294.1 SDR family oxidoreductase [Planktothrix agardhii KL2]MCB8752828.1 SDR family oxidoreductase [Planktothrix agardhii 1810]
MSLVQKRALITGASSGIGRATAIAFAKAGIDIALVSRQKDRLESVAKEARNLGVEAKAFPLDLAKVEQVHTQIDSIVAAFGSVNILVNNAGMGYTGDLIETSLADWQKVIDLNLTSVFQCIKGVLPGMRDQGSGTIINVVSIAGLQVFPNWGAYCVSKFGLMALSKTLNIEERANGIRVTALCPGSVNTPIWDSETVKADFDRSAMLTPEIVAESILYVALLPTSAVIEELTLMPSVGKF